MGGKSGKPGAPSSGGGAGMSYRNPGAASDMGGDYGGGSGTGMQYNTSAPVNPVTGMGGPPSSVGPTGQTQWQDLGGDQWAQTMQKDNSDPAGAGMGAGLQAFQPPQDANTTRQAILDRFAPQEAGMARAQRNPMMHTGAGGKKSGTPPPPNMGGAGMMGSAPAPVAPTGSMGGSTELNAPGLGGRSMEQVLQQMRAARGG